MADVLLGRSEGIEGFERHVVLKRIRPEHAHDQRFIRMFLDEARVAANLHHQHIVQVHDVGESAGEYFIAMEYIHGEDVRTLLQTASRTRMHVPLGYAIMIVAAAAAGLHYAHERRGPDKRSLGIVHRDISPSNILVGHDGSIKIVDFGIAKAATHQETRSGNLKGKVAYMSPEQCKSDSIDRRSDVYSLGVVLYELATTTRLFKGENDYLVMDQIVNGRVTLPRVRRPDLPNELSAIIMRALAPDPERRYFTADELRVALDHFAAKAGLTASPSSLAAYMRKQFGDRPEPWLDLKGKAGSLDDVESSVRASPAQSWTELPRSDDNRRSGAIARPSAPIRAITSESTEPIAAAHDSARHISAERALLTPSPTDSKMGWESQQPPLPAQRGITPIKLSLVAAPLIVLLGFAAWRLAGTGDGASPVAAVATSAVMPPPAPPPIVTPIPVPAAPQPVAAPAPAREPASSPPAARSAVTSEPVKRSPSVRKPAIAKIAETAPPKVESKMESSAAQGASKPAAVASGPQPGSAPPASPAGSSAVITTLSVPTPAAATPATAVVTAPAVAPAGVSPAALPAAAPAVAIAQGPAQITHNVVEHVASAHLRELSKCDSEDTHGEITVKFIVDASGKVAKSQLTSAIKKHKLAACILRSVQGWQFPRQGPSGAEGTYTLSFQ